MPRIQEHSGLAYLREVTALLQRARLEHPTEGLWEAADRQWWWRAARPSDEHRQLFWYDDHGPIAAAVTNTWSSATWLDLMVIPSVRHALLAEVLERGLRLASSLPSVEMLVDDEDAPLTELLAKAGFSKGAGDATAWMPASQRPEIPLLAEGYTLYTRDQNASALHHFARRGGDDVERRLRQTSLYRPDVDLFVTDRDGDIAAYGLFWPDPVTGVGLVEPMRTEDAHQGRGLARHVLTTGISKLIDAGSKRIKVSYEGDNAPAVALYLGVGFERSMTCSTWTAPTP